MVPGRCPMVLGSCPMVLGSFPMVPEGVSWCRKVSHGAGRVSHEAGDGVPWCRKYVPFPKLLTPPPHVCPPEAHDLCFKPCGLVGSSHHKAHSPNFLILSIHTRISRDIIVSLKVSVIPSVTLVALIMLSHFLVAAVIPLISSSPSCTPPPGRFLFCLYLHLVAKKIGSPHCSGRPKLCQKTTPKLVSLRLPLLYIKLLLKDF